MSRYEQNELNVKQNKKHQPFLRKWNSNFENGFPFRLLMVCVYVFFLYMYFAID